MQYSSSFIISALAETWNSLGGYCRELGEEQWIALSNCPGWSVGDILSHIVGTERSLLGDQTPVMDDDQVGSHVKNEIGRSNEAWIKSLRSKSSAEILDQFESCVTKRLEVLGSMTEEEFSKESWTPIGKGTYRDFMVIRVMDCFVHEQDIRISSGGSFLAHDRSGKISYDQLVSGLGFVVGKKVKAKEGTQVRFEIEVNPGNVDTIRILIRDGRAVVARDDAKEIDDASLTMTFEAFVFAAAGRLNAHSYLEDGSVKIGSDSELGTAVYQNLGFLI
ncbi:MULTISPECIES: maleylpyruvate isomerase family mycothiol-dependent enzyme [Acidithrix]|uniref:Mycothiol-dependent maleylpyruvate isomerase metal-binding domain-containing protein n=1 Tax=Acidithrix ferrooxidans TaxID=1280514 RepID=A0A0D8HDF0_9ACTN|nr:MULTISPECIES: maleylpyruvate isomerase family mycothiol-dependent enzyme [Acidithrix]KJF15980.1 hypothetical protein AXFE_31760 [Acidithrix ferrooxidans]